MRDEPLTVSALPGNDASVTILKLQGPLTLQGIFAFQQELAEHKPQLLIVDLTATPYMDSAGLGSLMNGYVSAERNGRRFLLAGANERVTALLETTKVHQILKNYPTAADAEASVRT
jgi:anti-sigma B factor antagonist